MGASYSRRHGGCHLGHIVTELVRVTTKDISEDQADLAKVVCTGVGRRMVPNKESLKSGPSENRTRDPCIYRSG